jgi:hypothetical protein
MKGSLKYSENCIFWLAPRYIVTRHVEEKREYNDLGVGSTFVVDFSAEEIKQNVVANIPKKDVRLESGS